jgi:hypothetical protein
MVDPFRVTADGAGGTRIEGGASTPGHVYRYRALRSTLSRVRAAQLYARGVKSGMILPQGSAFTLI